MRYSTAGDSVLDNAQPIVVKTSMGPLALVHNGNLVNAAELRAASSSRRARSSRPPATPRSILHLMARNPRDGRRSRR